MTWVVASIYSEGLQVFSSLVLELTGWLVQSCAGRVGRLRRRFLGGLVHWLRLGFCGVGV